MNELKKYQVYMHRACADLALRINRLVDSTEVIHVYEVHYINLGYMGNPWTILPEPDVISIRVVDLDNWVNITDKMFNKRIRPGLPT